MANITHLEMCDTLVALPEIEVKKSFFGLKTRILYTPTSSPVSVYQNEYAADAGSRLETILHAEPDAVPGMIAHQELVSTGVGSTRLDACISADRQFAAVQLLRFQDFTYRPLTEMQVFHGAAAEAIASLFK